MMRVLAAVLVGAAFTYGAGAQGFATASGPGSYVAAGAGYSLFAADYSQRTLGGVMAFVDVHPAWRYGVEGEVRLLRQHSDEGTTQSSYLVGPIVYLRSHRLRPYVKFLIGAGHINFPFGYGQGTYLAYAPGAGADYVLNDRISVRAIDVEYQRWPQFTFGELHPYGVSAGIVVRLTGMRLYPRH